MRVNEPIDSGAVTIASASLTSVCEIRLDGHPCFLGVTIGAAAITKFQFQIKSHADDSYDPWKTDTDFNTPTQQMPDIFGSGIPTTPLYTTAAAGTFKIYFHLPGAHYLKILAATATSTTVRVRGNVYRPLRGAA